MKGLQILLAGLLTTVYKMSDDQVAALVAKADGEDFDAQSELNTILESDKNRIGTLKTDAFNDGHKKGKSESLKDLEKQVRSEFGVTDDSIKGIDLIKAVHALDREAGKNGLTDDDVKKHSLFIQLQKKLDDTNKDVDTKVSEAIKEAETKFNRERTLTSVKAKALEVFDGLNPVLSDDKAKAAKQKEIILRELEGYDYDTAEDGSFIVKKEGKALGDDHGNLVDFNQLVKNTASTYFDFKQSSARGTEGNKTTTTGGPITVPKNEDEYLKTIQDRSIPIEQRNEIKEAWNKQQA
ncbi:hypothetical protein FAZ19_16250 [Sphingobacterium alkalisoli]|uniref:Uncharacterized protein n=1 Tax=Sphingobacterium alkalisoli TaxID=1874115 RepID=A0A4U0GXM3_9SPHI|nr:hypothetical protein [Sphingobacterium alkalisoli]TJY63818.1 hypothetical protein FAZ19_16250 [Sphingobacterium alkalisoli]GGH24679.1 hypothetical protein GCM10011418_32760 [Sphingobacterium alkalisoli]